MLLPCIAPAGILSRLAPRLRARCYASKSAPIATRSSPASRSWSTPLVVSSVFKRNTPAHKPQQKSKFPFLEDGAHLAPHFLFWPPHGLAASDVSRARSVLNSLCGHSIAHVRGRSPHGIRRIGTALRHASQHLYPSFRFRHCCRSHL